MAPGNRARFARGAPRGEVFQMDSDPATLTLVHDITTAGDSTEFGVGSDAASAWPVQVSAALSGGAVLRKGVSGMAFAIPGTGSNTNPIPTQISGQGATPLANNTQIFTGGLNDYNTVVNPEPAAQAWATGIVATSIPNIVASLTGGPSQWWSYMGGLAEEFSGPGMSNWAEWRWMMRQLSATYGAHIFDIRRYMMSTVASHLTDPDYRSDLDYINVRTWFGLPLSFHGNGIVSSVADFASTPVAPWAICSTATNTAAGVEAVASAAGYATGQLIQNINSGGVLGNNIYRKVNGAWTLVDLKHLSKFGNAVWALAVKRIAWAIQGQGAPLACPAELFCAQDATAGTTIGTIYYVGAAPTKAVLFDAALIQSTTLALTDNGSVNNAGSITVKRSSSGTLAEGEQLVLLQLTGNGHVLTSAHDFRIGQPSTQTVPRMLAGPNLTSTASSDGDWTYVGRVAHGLADGDKFFAVGWVTPTVINGNHYLIALGAGHGNVSDILIRVTNTGALGVVMHNAANVLLSNVVNAGVFTAGTATWFAIDIDLSVSTPTVKGYYNKAGAGADVAINATGVASTGPTTIAASKTVPRFFSIRDASIANQNFGAFPDTVRGQFRGKVGNLIFGAGNIGIAGNAALFRTLCNLDNSPVARTPYATIGGLRPMWDFPQGIGDQLNGGSDPNEPIFGTYSRIKALV